MKRSSRARAETGRAGAVLLFVGALACSSGIDAGSVEAEVVAYGRYARTESGPVPVEESSTIRCERGALFGVDYRVSIEGDGSGVLPVSFWWVHPEFAIPSRKLWGTETQARPSGPRVERGDGGLSGRAIWALDAPEERVDGSYRFEIRSMEDGRVLLLVPFEVEGC